MSSFVIGESKIELRDPRVAIDREARHEVLWLNEDEYLECDLPVVYDYVEAASDWAREPDWSLVHDPEDDPDDMWAICLIGTREVERIAALAGGDEMVAWVRAEYARTAARNPSEEPLP